MITSTPDNRLLKDLRDGQVHHAMLIQHSFLAMSRLFNLMLPYNINNIDRR